MGLAMRRYVGRGCLRTEDSVLGKAGGLGLFGLGWVRHRPVADPGAEDHRSPIYSASVGAGEVLIRDVFS